MVKVLIRAGADIQHEHAIENVSGITLLHFAAEAGHSDIVRLLLDSGACIDARTSTQTTPLHQASMNGHTDIVRILILAGADLKVQDDNGTAPEMFAKHQGHEETVLAIQLMIEAQLENE